MLLTKIMRLTITSICSFLEFFGRQVLHEAKKEACAGRPLLCCCLVAKSCPTLCDSMDCTPPGSSVLHYLLKFARVDGVIQPSHPLHCVECCLNCPYHPRLMKASSFLLQQTTATPHSTHSTGPPKDRVWDGHRGAPSPWGHQDSG